MFFWFLLHCFFLFPQFPFIWNLCSNNCLNEEYWKRIFCVHKEEIDKKIIIFGFKKVIIDTKYAELLKEILLGIEPTGLLIHYCELNNFGNRLPIRPHL